jgi:hypothetical protein
MTKYSPSPIHTVNVYKIITYSQMEGMGEGGGGEQTREKVRGAVVQKAGRKYQHDWLYLQSINSIKHQ